MAARGVLRAAAKVSTFLTRQKIPHALVGGLAVGAHGFNRATDNVDFAVFKADRAALEQTGTTVAIDRSLRGVLVQSGRVLVRFHLFAKPLRRSDLSSPVWLGRLPVVRLDGLVAMKVAAGRLKDFTDIVELLKLGRVDVPAVFDRLFSDHDLSQFQDLVTIADLEQRGRNREGRRLVLAVLARCTARAATSGK